MNSPEKRRLIADTLAAIASEGGGILTPDAVLAHAAAKSSPLHDCFEWDNKVAAQQYRLDQARELIRSVRVVITTEKTTVSTVAYVRDPDLDAGDQGYVATAVIASDKDKARSALVAEFSRAASALRRARELAVAFEMVGQVEAVAETVETMRTRVQSSVEQRLHS